MSGESEHSGAKRHASAREGKVKGVLAVGDVKAKAALAGWLAGLVYIMGSST